MTPCIYFESRTEFLTWYGVWRLVILFFPGGWTVFCLAAIFIRMGYFLYPHGHKCTARIIQGFTKFKPCFLLPPGKFNCKQVLLLTWALEPPYCHISLRPSVKHRARWASYKKSESLLLIKELQDFDWFWKVAWSYIFSARYYLKISWNKRNISSLKILRWGTFFLILSYIWSQQQHRVVSMHMASCILAWLVFL